MTRPVLFLLACLVIASPTLGQAEPEVLTLENGMKFILLPKSEGPNSAIPSEVWVMEVIKHRFKFLWNLKELRLLKKLEVKIQPGSKEVFPEPDEEGFAEKENMVETFVEAPQTRVLVLTPQQLAQANEFLGNLEGKSLGDLEQINAALQGAIIAVPEDDRVILEYILQKLSVYIAEID